MSIDEEEIRQYLEGKQKLKNIVLPDNVNDLDQGSDNPDAKQKIGQKSSQARAEYIIQRDIRMQYGDKQAIAEFATEQNEIRRRLEQQKERSRMEYDLAREEDKLNKELSKITQEDRDKEAEDIQKYENLKQNEIDNVYDYFNCPEPEWEKWLSDGHKPEQSPANVLIVRSDRGNWCCDIHRYNACIPFPNGRLASSAFTPEAIEDHIRRYEPEMHKAAVIESINERYSKLIEARREKTLENKEVAFKREVRDIDSFKASVGGDVIHQVTKLTNGQKAKIRRQEESENEKNRKIYRGLY